MATAKEVLVRLEGHEVLCGARYSNIEKELSNGSIRFRKLERMLWGMYPLILGSTFFERMFQ